MSPRTVPARLFEQRFPSQHGIELDMLIAAPERPDSDTGAILWLHGWGGNRYQYKPMLSAIAQLFNAYVVSPEWRGSGFDADPQRGEGISVPYDFGFYQVVDCINALWAATEMLAINPRRLFAWGGGQGGHVALLTSIYAPSTFACVMSLSGFSHVDSVREPRLGWHLTPLDRQVRDVRALAASIRCKVWLVHGDRDESVSVAHSLDLAARLSAVGARFTTYIVRGGGHHLDPVTSRFDATVDRVGNDLTSLTTDGRSDFTIGAPVFLPCVDGSFVVTYETRPARVALLGGKANSPEITHN